MVFAARAHVRCSRGIAPDLSGVCSVVVNVTRMEASSSPPFARSYCIATGALDVVEPHYERVLAKFRSRELVDVVEPVGNRFVRGLHGHACTTKWPFVDAKPLVLSQLADAWRVAVVTFSASPIQERPSSPSYAAVHSTSIARLPTPCSASSARS